MIKQIFNYNIYIFAYLMEISMHGNIVQVFVIYKWFVTHSMFNHSFVLVCFKWHNGLPWKTSILLRTCKSSSGGSFLRYNWTVLTFLFHELWYSSTKIVFLFFMYASMRKRSKTYQWHWKKLRPREPPITPG